MSKASKQNIEVGFQVFLADGGEEVGAVRDLCGGRPEILVYVENAGDFPVPLDVIKAVHYQKVILDSGRLPSDLRRAVGAAHTAETNDEPT
jgi:hypothetical protein